MRPRWLSGDGGNCGGHTQAAQGRFVPTETMAARATDTTSARLILIWSLLGARVPILNLGYLGVCCGYAIPA